MSDSEQKTQEEYIERQTPNILITGTPGTGKTTLSQLASDLTGLLHINVGDLVKEKSLHQGFDQEFQSWILDDDKLIDELEETLSNGGNIVDFHSCEVFPERWFDLILVLRTDNTTLYDRLKERGYSAKKITENIDSEIFQVILEEARESYSAGIVVELQSNNIEDMQSNVARIEEWVKAWKARTNGKDCQKNNIMDKDTRRYGSSRQMVQKTTKKAKTPTTSRLKPPKHSASPSNKIDCEPNPSSIPPKKPNTNISSIYDQNIIAQSGDFGDSKIVENQTIVTSYVTTSPKLPPKKSNKSNKRKPASRNNITNVKTKNINDESIILDNIEQVDEEDGVVLIITKKPTAIVNNRPSIPPKNPIRRPTTIANIPKRTSSINVINTNVNTNIKVRDRSSASVVPSPTFKSGTFNVSPVHYPSEKISETDNLRRGSKIMPKKSIQNPSISKTIPTKNAKSNARLSKKNSPVITPSTIPETKRDNMLSASSSSSSSTLIQHRKSSPSTSIQNRNSSFSTSIQNRDLLSLTSIQNRDLLFSTSMLNRDSAYSSSIQHRNSLSLTSIQHRSSLSSASIQHRDSYLKPHPPSPLSKFSFTPSDINPNINHIESFSQNSLSEAPSIEDDDLKRRKQLWNVIKELVDTERAFLQDMKLLEEVYFIQARDIPIFDQYDCKTIFSNLPEIIKFSADFLDLLLAASGIDELNDDPDKRHKLENDETYIGDVFAQMMRKHQGDSRLEKVYGEYCKRHEAAVQKLREFDKDDNKCKNQCNGRTTSWDLTSLLIKPVQRVLKYPLLLQQILSRTKPSHPDYEQLQFSLSEITKVASRINEIKKRKDIVEKIKRNDIKAAEDELYNAFVEKFKALEQRGIQLVKEVKCWVKSIKSFFEDQRRLAAAIEEFHTLELSSNKDREIPKMIEYGKAIKSLEYSCGKEMEDAIKKVLFPQIEKFLSLFKAPAAVMRKRERKLLDYCHANLLKIKGEIPEKSLQQSADAFVSISEQLREELPAFFMFMIEYFDILVQELIKIQARFYRQMSMDFQQYFYKFVDLQALEQISDDRELVMRNMDIVGEYNNYFNGTLKMDEELYKFVLLNHEQTPTEVTEDIVDRSERNSKTSESIRSSTSSRRLEKSKEHRKGCIWTDDNGLSLFSDYSSDNKIQNLYELNNDNSDYKAIKHKSEQNYGTHKKYSTDSVFGCRSSFDSSNL
ncbi:9766_t:CDS:10 [Scutellospora calospora]|uniref:9766_t:CDS:1 n=1 Tax=Scutellospora calospora TaxID=85575 RepID=A0ACA9JUS7_9GLOM|nr:9766_t:CDS:10 [Scutellospora calospora]